eukprot:TCONS_00044526-protein
MVRTPKYPCGVCQKAVTNRGNNISCDVCMQWHHSSCIGMSDLIFDLYVAHKELSWSCLKCGLPNVGDSIFDSTISSTSSTDSEERPPKVKAKSLNILIINFQSIWGKKEAFAKVLFDSKTDIVLCTETHLDPALKDNEFLPKGYESFRNDRDDGWGGVMIIYKNNLICEEVYKSKTTELIAVKVETFRKPIILCAAYRPPETK